MSFSLHIMTFKWDCADFKTTFRFIVRSKLSSTRRVMDLWINMDQATFLHLLLIFNIISLFFPVLIIFLHMTISLGIIYWFWLWNHQFIKICYIKCKYSKSTNVSHQIMPYELLGCPIIEKILSKWKFYFSKVVGLEAC